MRRERRAGTEVGRELADPQVEQQVHQRQEVVRRTRLLQPPVLVLVGREEEAEAGLFQTREADEQQQATFLSLPPRPCLEVEGVEGGQDGSVEEGEGVQGHGGGLCLEEREEGVEEVQVQLEQQAATEGRVLEIKRSKERGRI